MKFLKHKKINNKISKKPGRPKKLSTRAANHQKRISKVNKKIITNRLIINFKVKRFDKAIKSQARGKL